MKTDEKKLLINRILLFAFSLIATPVGFIAYALLPAHNGAEFYNILVYLMFFTIGSNIFVFAGSALSMINIYHPSEKLNNILEHGLVKGSTVLFIFITGVVFNFVIFPGLIFLEPEKGQGIVDGGFGSSFLEHVLVPIFMTRDFILTRGAKLKEKLNAKQITVMTLISVVVPVSGLVISLPLLAFGVIPPQYPFMHLFDTHGVALAINICIIIGISVAGISLFAGTLIYSNRNAK